MASFQTIPFELRLAISDQIVDWRDLSAFRHLDRANYSLLTNNQLIARFPVPDCILDYERYVSVQVISNRLLGKVVLKAFDASTLSVTNYTSEPPASSTLLVDETVTTRIPKSLRPYLSDHLLGSILGRNFHFLLLKIAKQDAKFKKPDENARQRHIDKAIWLLRHFGCIDGIRSMLPVREIDDLLHAHDLVRISSNLTEYLDGSYRDYKHTELYEYPHMATFTNIPAEVRIEIAHIITSWTDYTSYRHLDKTNYSLFTNYSVIQKFPVDEPVLEFGRIIRRLALCSYEFGWEVIDLLSTCGIKIQPKRTADHYRPHATAPGHFCPSFDVLRSIRERHLHFLLLKITNRNFVCELPTLLNRNQYVRSAEELMEYTLSGGTGCMVPLTKPELNKIMKKSLVKDACTYLSFCFQQPEAVMSEAFSKTSFYQRFSFVLAEAAVVALPATDHPWSTVEGLKLGMKKIGEDLCGAHFFINGFERLFYLSNPDVTKDTSIPRETAAMGERLKLLDACCLRRT
ncbi:hypothetical protein BJ508DRAFT_331056 [Ascobolus immersus RN42]|uniref:Uncharacterized protein n=1 Tax=Ascobolus immersus RN42 TaxID=1160509 RepID=A0A3N4HT86_ASCIM|nr:hypothetical protein BJ508DRAFT_331056 [Ascobolus immersus RN42]